MSSFQAAIRDGLKAKVEELKHKLVIPDFLINSTYYPKSTLSGIGDKPELHFVAMGISSSRERVLRDTSALELMIPVQVALQQRVDTRDTASIDVLVELAEQIMDIGEDDELVADGPNGESYVWQETVPLLDDNGLVYSYEQLTVDNVFQAIWTFQYVYIKQAKLVS